MKLHHLLSPFSVIASVRNMKKMNAAIQQGVKHVFLVRSTLNELTEYAKIAEANNNHLYVYFDMIRGVSNDKEAIIFLNNHVKISGIVSNKAHIVNEAMNQGLYGIFTFFLLDSYSLKLGGKAIRDLQPDAVNVVPGNLPSTIEEMIQEFDIPIIASGLIKNPSEVQALYHAGCSAISSSTNELWSLQASELEGQDDHE